jgi:hypothetical protein
MSSISANAAMSAGATTASEDSVCVFMCLKLKQVDDEESLPASAARKSVYDQSFCLVREFVGYSYFRSRP